MRQVHKRLTVLAQLARSGLVNLVQALPCRMKDYGVTPSIFDESTCGAMTTLRGHTDEASAQESETCDDD